MYRPPSSDPLGRGVWCLGKNENGDLVLAAIDSREQFRKIEIVHPKMEPKTRAILDEFLDLVDPAPLYLIS